MSISRTGVNWNAKMNDLKDDTSNIWFRCQLSLAMGSVIVAALVFIGACCLRTLQQNHFDFNLSTCTFFSFFLARLSEVIILCIGFINLLLKKLPREAETQPDLELGAGPSKIHSGFWKSFRDKTKGIGAAYSRCKKSILQVDMICVAGPFEKL